jgi:hypothetical protein
MSKKRSDFVVIQKCQGQLTAEVTKSHLESEGIPVLLQPESIGRVYGVISGGLGMVRILVPQEYAEEAKEIIENISFPPDQ